MLQYGSSHCALLKSSGQTFDTKLLATYYDAERVYYQIYDYTGDDFWLSCAAAAESIYRDQYVIANSGYIPGYWNFPHGMAQDYLRTGDVSSKNALITLSQNAAFSRDTTPAGDTVHVDASREVAYAIMAYLNAELVGASRRARLSLLVDQAFGHLDQWFVQKNAPYIRPFMVALTSEALIMYHEMVGDRDTVPHIERAANWLWDNMWLPANEAFKYTDRNHSTGGMEPAPDLNLLIAPVYAWLYHQTGNTVHLERADKIFAGGVRYAYLVNGKQYNQNYRWSFEYLRLRSLPPLR